MNIIMVTNNPLIHDYYKNEIEIVFDEHATYLQVLEMALDKVLVSYKLINHPLYSNLKTSETPYRTILLSPVDRFDPESYKLLEQSVETVTMQLKQKQPPHYKENIYKDYQMIDKDLICHMID